MSCTPATKQCPNCERDLSGDAFYRKRQRGHIYLSSWCKDCERVRCHEGHYVGRERGVMLPAAPFRAWLERLAEHHRRLLAWGYDDRGRRFQGRVLDDAITTALAEATGLTVTTIYDIRKGYQRTVHIDTVDAAVIREGNSFLWDIYPSLYSFPSDESEAA